MPPFLSQFMQFVRYSLTLISNSCKLHVLAKWVIFSSPATLCLKIGGVYATLDIEEPFTGQFKIIRKRNNTMKKFGIALIALLLGGLIYIFWRSETLMMFAWLEYLGLEKFIRSMRDITLELSLPNWVLFSLPNALWLFSGLLLFDFIWGSEASVSKLFWFSIFWMIAICTEMSQALRLIPGTFDWQDMTFIILAGFFALLLITPSIQKERRQDI